MSSYTVHLPPGGELERVRFVREGVSFLALVFPMIWLLLNRLFLPLLVYVALGLAISLFGARISIAAAAALSMLPAFFLFVEGNQLLRHRLAREGWRDGGVVTASNDEEAAIRYFHRLQKRPAPAARPPVVAPPRRTTGVAVPGSFGMFPD